MNIWHRMWDNDSREMINMNVIDMWIKWLSVDIWVAHVMYYSWKMNSNLWSPGRTFIWTSNFLETPFFDKFDWLMMVWYTDYGHPERVFFQKFETFGLGQKNWAEILWGIWDITGQTINLNIWVRQLSYPSYHWLRPRFQLWNGSNGRG